jgi:hypothetical protein
MHHSTDEGLWGLMVAAIASIVVMLICFALLDVAFGGTAEGKNPPCPKLERKI